MHVVFCRRVSTLHLTLNCYLSPSQGRLQRRTRATPGGQVASPKRQRGQITQSEAQAKFKVTDTDFVVMRSRGLRTTGRVVLWNGRSVPLFKAGDVRAAARLVKNR